MTLNINFAPKQRLSDLDAAQGILIGVAIGAAMWGAIILFGF